MGWCAVPRHVTHGLAMATPCTDELWFLASHQPRGFLSRKSWVPRHVSRGKFPENKDVGLAGNCSTFYFYLARAHTHTHARAHEYLLDSGERERGEEDNQQSGIPIHHHHLIDHQQPLWFIYYFFFFYLSGRKVARGQCQSFSTNKTKKLKYHEYDYYFKNLEIVVVTTGWKNELFLPLLPITGIEDLLGQKWSWTLMVMSRYDHPG